MQLKHILWLLQMQTWYVISCKSANILRKQNETVNVSLSAGVLLCYGGENREYFSPLKISREEIQLSVTAVKITAPQKTNLYL